MHIAAGKYFIDGLDLWTKFGVIVRKGSNDGFLKQPKKKESLSHDWQDSNGLDVDLTKIYFEKRDVTLNMAMVADSENDFWRKHIAFFSMLSQPGLRRLTVKELDSDFFVYYNDCTTFSKAKSVRTTEKNLFLFSLVLTEPNPNLLTTTTYLADDEGRFIVT